MFDVWVSLPAHTRKLGLVEGLTVAVARFVVTLSNPGRSGSSHGSFGILLAVVSLLLACLSASVRCNGCGVVHRCGVGKGLDMAGLQSQAIEGSGSSILRLQS